MKHDYSAALLPNLNLQFDLIKVLGSLQDDDENFVPLYTDQEFQWLTLMTDQLFERSILTTFVSLGSKNHLPCLKIKVVPYVVMLTSIEYKQTVKIQISHRINEILTVFTGYKYQTKLQYQGLDPIYPFNDTWTFSTLYEFGNLQDLNGKICNFNVTFSLSHCS